MLRRRREQRKNKQICLSLETLESRQLLDGHGLLSDPPADEEPATEERFTTDLDEDGLVGFADFLILARNFGKPGNSSHGDADGDGLVGFSDFLELAKDFGKGRRVSEPPGQTGDKPDRKPDPPRQPLQSSRFTQKQSDFVKSINKERVRGELPFADVPEDAQVVYHPILQAGLPTETPPDSPENRIDPNTSLSPYAGVGSIEVVNPTLGSFLCTGTVISPTKVLTAAHCFDVDSDGEMDAGVEATFFLNDGGDFSSTHTVAQISLHPEFEGFAKNPHDDFAIIEFEAAVPSETQVYLISPDGIGDGQSLELVGYGLSGNGIDGFTVQPTFTDKRSGSNLAQLFITDDDDDGDLNDELYIFDFDGTSVTGFLPGGTLGNDVETTIGPGDSGGPAFVDIAGEKVIAGINTFNWELVGITPEPGLFGSLAGGNMTGAYIDWLFEMAPEAIRNNDAPTFNPGADVALLEDAGPQAISWATDIDPGRIGDTLSFEITDISNSELFLSLPSVSPEGLLSFEANADMSGTAEVTLRLVDDGGTAYGGTDTSAEYTLSISVTPVNDQPTVQIAGDITLDQGANRQSIRAFASGFNPGPLETDQALAEYLVSNDNAALFSSPPAIDNSGRLTFAPVANVVGNATVFVQARDTGGTANGGVDLSPVQSFVITLESTVDPPTPGDLSFDLAGDVELLEDAGGQQILSFATGIGPEVVGFAVSVGNEELFAELPEISRNGRLRFTAAGDAFGVSTVAVQAIGGDGSVSPAQSFNLVVSPVNDQPRVAVMGDVEVASVDGSSPPMTVVDFATFDDGSERESQTVLEYVLEHDNPQLFAIEPSIDGSGTLTFQLVDDALGDAHLRVLVRDDGGTDNGGIDTSERVSFVIRAVPDGGVDPVVFALTEDFHTIVETYGDFMFASRLMRSIDRVVNSIDDDFRPARNHLRVLQREVQSLINSGQLEEDGQVLLSITQQLQDYFDEQSG